jgi:hypothetical protein
MQGPLSRAGLLLAGAALLAGLAGCGDDERRYEIADHRTEAKPGPLGPLGNSADRRFLSGHGSMLGGGDASGPREGGKSRAWTAVAPPGWTELPPARMRDLGWRAGESGRVECTLSFLEGSGGGLLANLNRWRKQLSLPPVDAAAADALPTAPWLGVDARLVVLDGTYVGMGGGEAVPNARLIGLIASVEGGNAFLKMTGPAEAVEAERKGFLALAASLRRVEAPPAAERGGSGPREARGALAWTAPPGWVRQPDRPMRVVTFSPSASPDVVVYVTVLSGRAGGLAANVERWNREMGREPPTPDALASLERVPVLGSTGVYVEIEGTFTGMGAVPMAGALLLGMVVERDAGSVFVKMTGPADRVRAERGAFRAFCESLRE